MKKYKTSDFDYDLPPELIAQFPQKRRTASRLLCVDPKVASIEHRQFVDVCDYICADDLLVLNNTKVIPARLFGQKESGGKIECLIERIINEQEALAHIRSSKSPKIGSKIILEEAFSATVIARKDDLFHLEIAGDKKWLDLLNNHGKIPLPPYIQRAPDESDLSRYQTVFAKHHGAVAAPTAGLHFDEAMLEKLQAKGVQIVYLTLHVGAGTFMPVRVDDLDNHIMHSEYMEVDQGAVEAIKACKKRGGRVVAVGTTVVRSLETASRDGALKPFQGDTQLFITPGFKFQCVDTLITNFHLPQSTLLMLVSAFAGYELTMKAYQEAVQERYRFFSYGDAMIFS